MAADDDGVGMIGRDSELGSIARFLDAVPAGPAALVIRGEPGIGKTTVWTEGTAAARRASYAVISCRLAPGEAELPYLGLADLFAQVPEDVLAEIPVPQRRALEVALLRIEGEGRPMQQRAVAAAVLNALLILARSAPLVIAIDDVQWLDAPTRRVVRFAVRRISSAPIGMLVALRSSGGDEDPLDLAGGLPPDRLRQLRIGPLGLRALDRILRSRLDAAFSGPTLRRIEGTSRGNPFFALELGRALLDPAVPAMPGEPLPAPASLSQLLSARLGRLTKATREALLVASALSRPTVDLVGAAGASAPASAQALRRAAEAGLVELRGGSVAFTHPLLASVVYSQAAEPELRWLHRRLAGLVSDPAERARHLGLGAEGPDEAVAAMISEAAAQAAGRGAPDAAAVFFEQAVRLTPPAAVHDVVRRKLDAADQHVAAGDTARARVLFEEVLAIQDGGPARARALHRLGRLRVLEGDFGAAPAPLRQALEEVGNDLALRVAIERDLVFALANVGPMAELLPHARAAVRAAEASGQEVLLAEALDHLCMAEFVAGGGVDPELLERAVAVDRRVGAAPLLEHPGMATGRFPLAITLKGTDRFDEARELLRSLYTEHGEHGDESALLPVLFHLGELEFWAGNWEAAAHLAADARELAPRAGQAVAERRALTLTAMVQACLGDVEAARSDATTSLGLSEQAKDIPALIRSLWCLGFLELSLDNPGPAVEYLERALTLESLAGYDPGMLRIMPDAVEALAAVGRLEEASRLADRLESHGTRLDRPWALALGARSRAIVQAALGDLEGAQAALERAARAHDRLSQRFEIARTLLLTGSIRRRRKKKREAREYLGRAEAMFEALGARLWADRTRAELRRIGGRAASPFELTPTEQQVAGLVAEGSTNREVAAALFLSVKTIETNLTSIYRKLGVSSRRQLAQRIRSRSGQ